jgi:hypothetical protein
MLYSKLGSIPKPETDGTEGWIEVPEAPEAPEGKEVIWWYPPGWVVRDLKPQDTETSTWNWSQSEEAWVESEVVDSVFTSTEEVVSVPSASAAFGTAGPSINLYSAGEL